MVGGRGGITVSGMGTSAQPGLRFWARATFLVIRRPQLWVTAVRQAHRLAPGRWWRRPPFLPVPDREYLRFRLETQYGADGVPAPADLVTYLEWCHSNESVGGAA
jgi:hypothetical protein